MLTEEEKSFLKYRINTSINEHQKSVRRKRQRQFLIGSIAAIIVVVFLIVPYTGFNNSTSNIKKYVNTTNLDVDTDGDIKLVLNKEEEVRIADEMSEIKYSSSGGQVAINNSKKVAQSSENSFNTIIVPYGKRTKLTLSDGTKVWLNSGSKLTYPVVFSGKQREVYLTGEGVFDVKHNKKKPFYVVTNQYDVKVLGTVFNVSSYQDDSYASTALERGSVEIKYNGGSIFGKSSMKITPGTLAVYDVKTKNMSSRKVDVAKYMSWRDGKFILKKQRLDGILKKLSRYYNIEIEVVSEELNRETFSGHLDLKNNIEEVLDIIKQTSDLRYKIENNKIVIN
ncbi:FecR family protein [Aquimarina pacifica]|uniref:FecR family protein n=1 Tax=Aquimarina pacifica TaxID=1296415 RepID=UPI0004703051|nr:FecR domain-containing protein [Aquimarina pacifica]